MKRILIFCSLSIVITLVLFACYLYTAWGGSFNSIAFRENIGFILNGESIYAVAIVRVGFFEEQSIQFIARVEISPEDILQKGPDDPEVFMAIEEACDALELGIREELPGASIEIFNPRDGSWTPLGTVGYLVKYQSKKRGLKNSLISR